MVANGAIFSGYQEVTIPQPAWQHPPQTSQKRRCSPEVPVETSSPGLLSRFRRVWKITVCGARQEDNEALPAGGSDRHRTSRGSPAASRSPSGARWHGPALRRSDR
jgi:hypothetical protein